MQFGNSPYGGQNEWMGRMSGMGGFGMNNQGPLQIQQGMRNLMRGPEMPNGPGLQNPNPMASFQMGMQQRNPMMQNMNPQGGQMNPRPPTQIGHGIGAGALGGLDMAGILRMIQGLQGGNR